MLAASDIEETIESTLIGKLAFCNLEWHFSFQLEWSRGVTIHDGIHLYSTS